MPLCVCMSVFRNQQSINAIEIVNNSKLCNVLDKKQSCAALFLYMFKALDAIDRTLQKQRLLNIGLTEQWLV